MFDNLLIVVYFGEKKSDWNLVRFSYCVFCLVIAMQWCDYTYFKNMFSVNMALRLSPLAITVFQYSQCCFKLKLIQFVKNQYCVYRFLVIVYKHLLYSAEV